MYGYFALGLFYMWVRPALMHAFECGIEWYVWASPAPRYVFSLGLFYMWVGPGIMCERVCMGISRSSSIYK